MRSIVRLCLATLLLPGVTVHAAHAGSFHATFDGPFSGTAPLTVVVSATGDAGNEDACHSICGRVEFGADNFVTNCGWLYPCDPELAYAGLWMEAIGDLVCPGTYVIKAYATEGCTNCPDYSWHVEVAAPVLNLFSICDPSGTGCLVFASGTLDTDHIVRSSVDWGDGTPVEEFTWDQTGGGYRVPPHNFPESGHFTVKVSNEIEGIGCAWTQQAQIIVNPGYTTPVQASTWGRVKALYAR